MTSKRRFALIGVAGFVAPRHLRAIKDIGGDLIAAFDRSDSVGIIDSHFPNAHFETEFEEFSRYLAAPGNRIDYLSVCSPNHLHNAHIQYGLRAGADVICEKPLVIDPAHLDDLAVLEAETGHRVHSILQLRLHPAIIALRETLMQSPEVRHDVDLTYVTSRGAWYHRSWKGDPVKSGGIAANIGVHFFDMLSFLFGPLRNFALHLREANRSAGYLEFERARVRWFLSVDRADLPPDLPEGQTTYRSVAMGDGQEIEFSGGFTDLHTESYRAILKGRSFGLDDVRPSIELVTALRDCPLAPDQGRAHPFLERP